MLKMPTGEWKTATVDFHPDLEKAVDPVESLLDKVGGDIDIAFDTITEALDKDPNNQELRRQANLLVNRFDDLASELRNRVSH